MHSMGGTNQQPTEDHPQRKQQEQEQGCGKMKCRGPQYPWVVAIGITLMTFAFGCLLMLYSAHQLTFIRKSHTRRLDFETTFFASINNTACIVPELVNDAEQHQMIDFLNQRLSERSTWWDFSSSSSSSLSSSPPDGDLMASSPSAPLSPSLPYVFTPHELKSLTEWTNYITSVLNAESQLVHEGKHRVCADSTGDLLDYLMMMTHNSVFVDMRPDLDIHTLPLALQTMDLVTIEEILQWYWSEIALETMQQHWLAIDITGGKGPQRIANRLVCLADQAVISDRVCRRLLQRMPELAGTQSPETCCSSQLKCQRGSHHVPVGLGMKIVE
jgi:hypothetical protein